MKDEEYTPSHLVDLADKHLVKNYEWEKGFVLERADGSKLYDTEGKEYLDFLACYSAVNVGYGHPAIIAAINRQMALGLTVSSRRFLTKEITLFAKELAELCGMEKVLPMNTGAEAVETAMKIARKWGYVRKGIPLNNAEIIFCENNFHGRTLAIISASSILQYKEKFGPPIPGIKIISFGNAKKLEEAITPETAAFIFEPIQGEGGVIIPPAGYLTLVRKICDKYDVLMIADEVQTGFGRTGSLFACQREEVKPDLYILAKSLGGGMLPISAVVGSSQIMDVLKPGDHGSTFGGNSLACHVARTAMKIITEENLPSRARELGTYFLDRLHELKKRCFLIREVRGQGLLIGIEIIDSAPNAREFCRALYKEGFLCEKARDRVIRFSPPLTISREELDQGIEKIEKVFLDILDERKTYNASLNV